MTTETTRAPSAMHGARMAMATLARALRGLLRPISGPARPTEERQRRDVMLLSRREVLAAQIMEARRQHRPTRHLTSQAYSITHDILRGTR